MTNRSQRTSSNKRSRPDHRRCSDMPRGTSRRQRRGLGLASCSARAWGVLEAQEFTGPSFYQSIEGFRKVYDRCSGPGPAMGPFDSGMPMVPLEQLCQPSEDAAPPHLPPSFSPSPNKCSSSRASSIDKIEGCSACGEYADIVRQAAISSAQPRAQQGLPNPQLSSH